jgi:hydrogenase nickel incorporation protein HypA/HybF
LHELSISRSIAETVRRHAEGRPVASVRVEVGHLRQIVPGSLRHCWQLTVAGTDLDGSDLEVIEIPASIECLNCATRRELTEPVFRCAFCGSDHVSIASGEELTIASYDLEVG